MIRELREKLAADLAVLDVPVEPSWPDRVTPPLIFIQPPEAGSYVSGGRLFGGEYTVSVDVQIVIRDRDLATLEELIEGVLVNTVDWGLLGVDTPAMVTANNLEYFGTTIHLSKPARP